MKKFILLLLLAGFGVSYGQDLVLIRFTDKPSAPTYFSDPLLMLTQKALDRRAKYNIALDILDVPVEESYVNQLTAAGIEPIQVSKWFNGIFAWCTAAQVSQAESFSFVDEVETFVNNFGKPATEHNISGPMETKSSQKITKTEELLSFDYGETETQIKQLKLDFLHDLGFTGEGISIAVLDNGFPGVNNKNGFAYIRNNGQIKETYNFVNHTEDVYNAGGTHGTVVLSTIGGYIENEFVGTAIDADFYLFITEDNSHEMPDEEVHWIAAAEMADYYGVDVINTSLGYSEYDDSKYDYVYDDMDGETTYISRGAQFAADKGIMVVVSAGNSGNKQWHYITAPADAKDVFTIGAIDAYGIPANFSSYGPTPDGRIKPDVMAMGVWATIINQNGNIDYSSGTSFSSPIMSGAMACLIQAFPNFLPGELRQKVRESASHYNNPTDQMGYGIPDFSEAYDKCLGVTDFDMNSVKVYPNPTSGVFKIDSEIPVHQLQLISFEGKIVRRYNSVSQLDISDLPNGIYILKVQLTNGKTEVKKIIKK